MKTKTWAYGTEYLVEVITVLPEILAVKALESDEGFILMGHGIKELPNKGEIGKIIFTKGGPTGGHWVYHPQPSAQQRN